MDLKKLKYDLSIYKIKTIDLNILNNSFFFISKTDDEISLVCESKIIPNNYLTKEDNWKCFKINDILDFSLIGIISKIASILADNNIGVFVNSTYNTDYILVKDFNFNKAINVLTKAGYNIID